jgi:hypothetical protein
METLPKLYDSSYTIANGDATDRRAVVRFIRTDLGLERNVITVAVDLQDDEAKTVRWTIPLAGRYRQVQDNIYKVAERIYIHLMQHDPLWDLVSLDYGYLNQEQIHGIRVHLSVWAMAGYRAQGGDSIKKNQD